MWIDENKIDWEQLRKMKECLLELRNDLVFNFKYAKNDNIIEEKDHKQIDALRSIIHLLDYIQDRAVDTGCKTEEEVFGKL